MKCSYDFTCAVIAGFAFKKFCLNLLGATLLLCDTVYLQSVTECHGGMHDAWQAVASNHTQNIPETGDPVARKISAIKIS